MRSTTFAVAFLASAASFGQQPANAPYLDPSLSPEKRAADLVPRMTLEETKRSTAEQRSRHSASRHPCLQWWNEVLHGVAQGRATVFPEPIGRGATFDPDLVRRMADAISTEARAKFHEAQRPPRRRGRPGCGSGPHRVSGLLVAEHQYLPYSVGAAGRKLTAKIHISPAAWAWHSSRGCKATILDTEVIATPKHYAVHSGPEPLRHSFDAKVSEYDLLNTYPPVFKAAVTEGKADSVMRVDNSVDGVPGCASTDLLQKRLRDQWGFQGYVPAIAAPSATSTGATNTPPRRVPLPRLP